MVQNRATSAESTVRASAAGVASSVEPYAAPFWLPGGHLQTIVPALFARLPAVSYRRERWDTPDGDFIDLDWLVEDAPPAPHAPLLVLFHGLEGNSDSHYARAIMHAARQCGWRAVIPHFRSCSGAMNRAPRFYHSGDAAEIDWILKRLATPVLAIGVSLGGNALLRWLGEHAAESHRWVRAAAAVSAPIDLAAGGHALAHGFNRLYTRHFLNTLKRKSLLKLAQYPALFDRERMLAARNLHDFDDVVTAPLHGYRDADDYWRRASAKPILPEITVPTLLLNALNDPFLPVAALARADQVSASITLEHPAAGGHVGFMRPLRAGVRGAEPAREDWLARRLLAFLAPHWSP
ncbi:MAG: hydrolase [Janthinobacterium lividum]